MQLGLAAILEAFPAIRLKPGFRPRYEGIFPNKLRELWVELEAG